MTYRIDTVDDLGAHLTLAYVDARGEHEVAVCTNGQRFVMGVDLDDDTDEPVNTSKTPVLNIVVDGVRARDIDFSTFGSASNLRAAQTRYVAAYRSAQGMTDDSSITMEFFETVALLKQHFRPAIEAADQAAIDRQDGIADVRLDLVVKIITPRANTAFRDHTAEQVLSLLDVFETAEQMTHYEFDAYETVGEDELNRLNVDTLYDLFGSRFATAFYRRKHFLVGRQRLDDLYRERADLTHEIEKLEASTEALR